jgi:RNA polymerase subunit RPABC4/transcription elongation factor Spt4
MTNMTEVGDRYCPSCGKLVKASVAACPHCGWNFSKDSRPAKEAESPLRAVGEFIRDAIAERPVRPGVLPSGSEKTCPQCAETVKREAKICRFCGWSFVRSRSPKPPASKNSFESCMGCLGAIILGFLLLVMISQCTQDETANTSVTTSQY